MGIIVTKKLSGGGGSGSEIISQAEKLALELEMGFKAANLTNYKEFVYDSTSSDLILITIYEDITKAITLFTKSLSYNSTTSNLETIITTRISDGISLTKTLSYDASDNLSSIEAT